LGGGGTFCGATRIFIESMMPLLLKMVMMCMLGNIGIHILSFSLPRQQELRLAA
jgi:hypothetical protein